jgi:hypothetical protein
VAPAAPAVSTPEIGSSSNLAAVGNALAKLETHARMLSRGAHGKDGYDRDFAELDAEDRTNFSLALCTAAVRFPDLNRYDDILPYDACVWW